MSNIQLSVNCPKCGATNKFDQENIPTFCSFCGSALPNMMPHVDEAIKISLERQRHQMQMETADKEIRKEKIKSMGSKAEIVRYVIVGIGILTVLAILIATFITINNINHR